MSDRIVIQTADGCSAEDRPPRSRSAGLVVASMLTVALLAVLTTDDANAPPTSIAVPVQPFDPPHGDWGETAFDADGSFTAVVKGESGLLAVGSGSRVDSTPYAFSSSDGVTWEPVEGEWGPGDVITSVIGSDAGYLATGYRLGTERESLEQAEPRVWRSQSGTEFASVVTTGLPGTGILDQLVVHNGSFVASGWSGPANLEPLRPPGSDASAGIWRSDDGVTWVEVTPPGENLWFKDLSIVDSDLVLAGSAAERAAVWTSSDGSSWDSSQLPGPPGPAEVAVAAVPRGDEYLALVRSRADVEGLVSVWSVAPNGFWQPLRPEPRPSAVSWMEPVGRGLFAGAGFTRSIYPGGPELWVSEDGIDWTGVQITRGQSPWPPTIVTQVVDFEGELIAFGSRGGAPTSWTLLGP